jgi:hypothetical protein
MQKCRCKNTDSELELYLTKKTKLKGSTDQTHMRASDMVLGLGESAEHAPPRKSGCATHAVHAGLTPLGNDTGLRRVLRHMVTITVHGAACHRSKEFAVSRAGTAVLPEPPMA